MKVRESILLMGAALAPVAGFFPVQIHYGLMRGLDFLGLSTRSETAAASPPGFSFRILEFLQDWLAVTTAVIFAAGVLRLRFLVREGRSPEPFALIMIFYFLGATSHFFILHLAPFLFAVMALAVLANTRNAWVASREACEEPAHEGGTKQVAS